MRPVERGPFPELKDRRGQLRLIQEFTKYQQARRYLIDRLGPFCSYCEQRIPNPAVEHIFCKSGDPFKLLLWINFLLACTNCNSTKGHQLIIDILHHFWPDQHNTFKCFLYDATGIVKPHPTHLSDSEKVIAENTIKLFGLNAIPPSTGTLAYEEASDLRFENRVTAWKNATDWEAEYRTASMEVRQAFLKLLPAALGSGFFSVWMTVFQNHDEVKKVIISAFPGTKSEYFVPAPQP